MCRKSPSHYRRAGRNEGAQTGHFEDLTHSNRMLSITCERNAVLSQNNKTNNSTLNPSKTKTLALLIVVSDDLTALLNWTETGIENTDDFCDRWFPKTRR
jgi:hypothetical protein